MASSTALRELQRDLENKANDLSKLQKGNSFPPQSPSFLTLIYYCVNIFYWFNLINSSDIAKNHQVRKKYTIQLGENELVLKVLI